jgi:hypothetical protein
MLQDEVLAVKSAYTSFDLQMKLTTIVLALAKAT